jgi:hypothetical protein
LAKKKPAAKSKMTARRPPAKVPLAPSPAQVVPGGSENDVWSAPAAPAAPQKPASVSHVHGRRAEQPPEILPAAPPADDPDAIKIGQTQEGESPTPSPASPKKSDGPAIIIEHVSKDAP